MCVCIFMDVCVTMLVAHGVRVQWNAGSQEMEFLQKTYLVRRIRKHPIFLGGGGGLFFLFLLRTASVERFSSLWSSLKPVYTTVSLTKILVGSWELPLRVLSFRLQLWWSSKDFQTNKKIEDLCFGLHFLIIKEFCSELPFVIIIKNSDFLLGKGNFLCGGGGARFQPPPSVLILN